MCELHRWIRFLLASSCLALTINCGNARVSQSLKTANIRVSESPKFPPCAPPVEDVGLDMHNAGAFAYTSHVRVVNLFWYDGWNSVPQHSALQMEDINTAVRTLISSPYFAHTCQYGSPQLEFHKGLDTSGLNPCPNGDRPPTGRPLPTDIEAFLTCEEALPATGLPIVHGVPTFLIPGAPAVCSFCGTFLPCFVDAACRVAPNPTGDLLVNVFVPAGYRPYPSECHGYHFQVPTAPLGWPLSPLPLTQARPIYYTVIPVDCKSDIDQVMKTVSHEMIEVITDEMPGAFWYTRHNNASVASDAEAADICGKQVTADGNDWAIDSAGKHIEETEVGSLPWTDTHGTARTMSLAPYWSNKDNMCIAPTVVGPSPQPTCNDACGCSCRPGEICQAGECQKATCAVRCEAKFEQTSESCNGDPACICQAEQELSCCNKACRGQRCVRQRCE